MIHVTRNAALGRGEGRRVAEFLIGTVTLLAYHLVVVFALPLALRVATPLPLEVVRKAQHVGYALSMFLLLGLFEHWYLAVAGAFALPLLAYPLLTMWERHPSYRRLLTDRSAGGGELRRQMMYVQGAYAVLIGVFWGGLGPDWRPLVAAATMLWGFGDAAAALVGKFVGRRRVVHRAIEGAKTYEGTVAMVAAGAAATFFTLLLYGGAPWWVSLGAAALVAPLAGVVELFSRRGFDTLTVPLVSAAALVPWWLLAVALGA
jgi:phytol kinase